MSDREGEASPALMRAAMRYKRIFGDTPTIAHLPPDLHDAAARLLTRAVATGHAFKDDRAWYRALGLPPPPDDALV